MPPRVLVLLRGGLPVAVLHVTVLSFPSIFREGMQRNMALNKSRP